MRCHPGPSPTGTADVDTRELLEAWHHALNSGDVDRLLELSTEDIVVGGPQGGGHGHRLLAEWRDRSGVDLALVEVHGDGDVRVVEQDASWPAADVEAVTRVASIVEVRDGKVARVARYRSRDEAEAALVEGS
jgi:ketosteroid isomerase-like protein